jgi:AcrR family transcriptional regulator
MRVTAETQTATRERILEAARRLFAEKGFAATTTRDLAQEAEIAVGTLFNYFPNKEAIVATLATDAIAGLHFTFPDKPPRPSSGSPDYPLPHALGGRADAPRTGEGTARKGTTIEPYTADSFEEALFAFVAAGLRKLKPLRKHLPAALETVFSPVAIADDEGRSFRASHLETVIALARRHGLTELSPAAVQLYWSLYIGLLLFWATDRSPRQEDTLALLDHSVEMFAGWLRKE